ncbi:MAG TPA: hypothetical protein VJB08_05990 [Candidatus Nanoarchaeia archaeon]|nr:hypothetical protein [Candidatus Nanoarchaeia archaeon]
MKPHYTLFFIIGGSILYGAFAFFLLKGFVDVNNLNSLASLILGIASVLLLVYFLIRLKDYLR